MVRRYDEAIEVRTVPAEGGATVVATAPDSFVWRGRLYVVRAVLDHWREQPGWWRHVRDATGGEVLPDTRERQVWRVEASPGRLAGRGVYDLGLDRADGGGLGDWQLLRAGSEEPR